MQKKMLHLTGAGIIALCALAAGSGIWVHHNYTRSVIRQSSAKAAELPPDLQNDLRKHFPHLTAVATLNTGVFRLNDAAGALCGYLLLEKISDDQRTLGFADTIEIALVLTPERRITWVLIGKNSETPRWLEKVKNSGFFTRWQNMTLAEAAAKKADAVTGATYTSTAIADGVYKCAAAYCNEELK